MVAQTYDPLGLLQPFILPAKKILQKACQMGLPWDELMSVTGGLGKLWIQWLRALPNLEAISFARTFKCTDREVKSIELHVFCDASTDGYGACAYLRFIYSDNHISCALVMGKSRVAPVNIISVPRLELTAAVIGAKLAVMIRHELEYDLKWCCVMD